MMLVAKIPNAEAVDVLSWVLTLEMEAKRVESIITHVLGKEKVNFLSLI